ncbi:hypothetical protein PHO31112_02106 [Pandoraea horticolens]|uniref:Transmembrane protein n=1 Tax=Pandoraea horticolens TaxID=2508298 RepID=A0A5E4UKV5_9BURK|nr:hypothetical protein PHO31112_02106 [Pandoraea horticolens]
MRLDPNLTPAVHHATTPQRSEGANQNDSAITIDFPPAPDDVRLHRQMGGRVCQEGCSSLLTGLAVTILGLAGVVSGTYFIVDAAATVDDSSLARSNQRAEYTAGGSLLGLGVMAVTIGLSRLCAGWEERRASAVEIRELRVGTQYEMTGGDAREYA